MDIKTLTRTYDQLIHRTIPKDVQTEWTWQRRIDALDEGADPEDMETVLEQCRKRTDAAMQKAKILYRQAGNRVRLPPVPRPHRP